MLETRAVSRPTGHTAKLPGWQTLQQQRPWLLLPLQLAPLLTRHRLLHQHKLRPRLLPLLLLVVSPMLLLLQQQGCNLKPNLAR
jgi:hypothetical protein